MRFQFVARCATMGKNIAAAEGPAAPTHDNFVKSTYDG